MIKSFFRIALGNILRHKTGAFINVAGLATGLAASFLILLWVQDELSYEKFNENAENIYRVEEDQFYSGERYHVTVTPHPSGPVWKEKIPEIKDQTRVNRLPRILFRQGENVFFETQVVAADSGLFRIFTLPLVQGDRMTLLRAPHSIVLTESLANKYFGTDNPMGKTLNLENRYQFTVTGVMKDLPGNSMFTFGAVLPYSFLREIGAISDSWGNNSILTFLLMEEGFDIAAVNKKLTDVVLEFNPETQTKFVLFPLTDIHLHAQFGYSSSNGPVIAVLIFTFIAVFVLLIACINFINLSTARAASRSKEIGIKKVAGADKKTLVMQFMLESLLLVFMAMILALLLVGLSLGVFNNITGKTFETSNLFSTKFILSFLAVGFSAALISGIYPAFVLSSFNPVEVLKGERKSGTGGITLRKVLVVIQFTLSILIAVTAIFLYKQLRYLQEIELGFDRKNLICIPMAEGMKQKYHSLKTELENETLIKGVTAARSNPVRIGSNSGGAGWDGKDPEKQVLIGTNAVDYDYLETMKMELVSGRDFSREFTSDLARDTTGNFLVNEEVAKIMGDGDVVGKNFSFMGLSGRIVGVLKNFHFKSADQPIEPIAFALADTRFLSFILIRLSGSDIPGSIKAVEGAWKIIPDYPLDYTFVDQDYENLFRTQMRLTSLLKYFTVLAVIIACLGLYGLSSYSTGRRTREVGIRKVMGAGQPEIVKLITFEFLIPVIISIVIAFPLAAVVVGKLLSQFANRIDMSISVFVLVALASVIIATLTVSYQAFRATRINPSEAVKNE
ncbi:MAG: ABC transporter permease [Bacteroidales bacterium]|nr:ABC transporter permease [Bacteroidales bacterium]